jgi:predicted GNAT family acetyltransferase
MRRRAGYNARMSPNDTSIRHEPEARRFVADLDRGQAVLEYAPGPDGALDYRHTFVPDALRGQGIASRLVRFALDYALAARVRVVPSCPFVAAFLDRHPGYESIDARTA